MKATKVRADAAKLPLAIPMVQRPLPKEVRYRFRDWVKDAWAGHRDSRLVKGMLAHEREIEATPWLTAMQSGLVSAVHRDRRDTSALQAVLEREAVALTAEYRELGAGLEAKLQAVEDAEAQKIDVSPTSPAEARDGEQHRLRRRHQARGKHIRETRAAVSSAMTRMQEIRQELGRLQAEFDLHETSYHLRAGALMNFYRKRQAVYIRRASHRATHEGWPPKFDALQIPVLKGNPLSKLEEEELG